jgi:hypothetical protein
MKTKLIFIAIISTFNIFSQIPSYIPSNGLLGWYPFNGNANDESTLGTNGTVNNVTLTSDRNNISNKAYYFNGVNSDIDLGINQSINSISNDFTISYWFNATNLGSIITNQGAMILASCGDNWRFNSRIVNDGRIGVSYIPDGNGSNWVGANSIANSVILNQWICFVMTRNGSTNNVYVNGNLITSSQLTNSPIQNSNNIITKIGRNFPSGQGQEYFTGKIDDIGFWNRALTTQEITNLYVGCNLNLVIPILTNANIGQNTQIASNVSNCQYVWQSNPNNVGWITLPSNGSYSNVTTNNLSINNIQVSNHLQEFRLIATQGNCVDTSNVSTIMVNDTCINTVNDTITTHITVTDTLLINVAFAGLTPPNNSNTIKVYPNPTNDVVFIDNGNYAMMSGYSIKITNSLGATVFNSPINQAVFNVSTTTFGARGLYYIHILNSNNAIIDTREIVLQ